MAMVYDNGEKVVSELNSLSVSLNGLKSVCGDNLLFMDNDNWAKVKEYIEKMQVEIKDISGELKSILNEMKVISKEVEEVKDRS